ncbi:MAG: hypothetical protein ACFB0B_19520 [Thermonemataceae bacterium]
MNSIAFFKHPDARILFAKIDYALKDGVHIQNRPHQAHLFRFIEKNEESLKAFYEEFYGVYLTREGETVEKYYYIAFDHNSRGNIPLEHRYFFPNEYVIVAFMVYKIIYIDGYVDLSSVSKLQKIIRHDYEDLKPDLYRTLAKAKKDKTTKVHDENIDKIVSDALKEFAKIGWIILDNDTFDPLPAFTRITKMYSEYINNLEDWLGKDEIS